MYPTNHSALNRNRFVHEDDERPLRDRNEEFCARADYEYQLQKDREIEELNNQSHDSLQTLPNRSL